jgi:23S rRNA (guanosine2251-2'-O)-methyltransferase
VVYYLRAHEVPTLGITEKATETIYENNLKGPIALVFGSEDIGISKGLLKVISNTAKLPMKETIGSLNVSVACGVVFYEVIRQRI